MRAKLCALALQKLGIKQGDVVGTLAWNTTRCAAKHSTAVCCSVLQTAAAAAALITVQLHAHTLMCACDTVSHLPP
jgi:3-oxoacyl-[acyl-carrier-protein] synthase III